MRYAQFPPGCLIWPEAGQVPAEGTPLETDMTVAMLGLVTHRMVRGKERGKGQCESSSLYTFGVHALPHCVSHVTHSLK